MNRQPMHTIHLHGGLARFGVTCRPGGLLPPDAPQVRNGQSPVASFKLAVNTPLEAIRALAMQIEGFGEAVKNGRFRLVRGKDPDSGMDYEVPYDAEKNAYDISMLHFSLGGDGDDFHIVPMLAGAGSGGGGKVILGAVIMVAAVVLAPWSATFAGIPGAIAGPGLSGVAFGGITYGGIAMFGATLMLSGISQMLQPSIKANYANNENPDQRASFFLGGQVNQNSQGGPVALAYGRCRVGSTVISAGLTAERI